MHSDQGIYTINNIYHDTRLGTDKRCTATDMPIPKNSIDCEVGEQHSFNSLSTQKRTFALLVDTFIVVAVLAVLLLIEFGIIPHHKGGFYCKDAKLSFDFQGDTVSISVLLSTVYIIPLVVVTVVEYKSCKRVVGELFRRIWCWYKEFLLGITSMLVLIEFMKVIVGEPRPHFFATCQPDTAYNCTIGVGVVSLLICIRKINRCASLRPT